MTAPGGSVFDLIDGVTPVSLLYTAVTLGLSYWVAHGRIAPRNTSTVDRLVLTWLIWDIIVHCTMVAIHYNCTFHMMETSVLFHVMQSNVTKTRVNAL